ncbi:MAG: prepilin-type N-terminal cleavage/methylation domain-containing protein [Verrucomicrobiota bacterium]
MHHSSRSHSPKSAGVAGFTLVETMIVVAIVALLAAIAVPGFTRARANAWRSSCLNNLRLIDNAKQQWALESRGDPDDLPTAPDLMPYLRKPSFPSCPGAGNYTIGKVSQIPGCDQPRHALDDASKRTE